MNLKQIPYNHAYKSLGKKDSMGMEKDMTNGLETKSLDGKSD